MVLSGVLITFESSKYITELKLANFIYIMLVIIGIVISVYNAVPFIKIFSGSFHLFQSWLVVISAYYLVINFGYKSIVYTVLMVAIPSSLAGILQALDFGFAWEVRALLGELQQNTTIMAFDSRFIESKSRPPGLTLFAISQAYLLITAIALSLLTYQHQHDQKKSVIIILIVIAFLFAGLAASETRSAMGAAAIMIFFTLLKTRPTATMLAFLVITAVGLTIKSYLSNANSGEVRALNFDDQSAKGRATLVKYGLELAIKKPLGYGYGLDSVEMAQDYFINDRNLFEYSANEKAQYLVEIHNAILNITHMFGLFGFILFLIYVFSLARLNWFFLLVLFSYLINSFFHNSGILNGDLYFDVFIGIMLYFKYRVVPTLEASSTLNNHCPTHPMAA